MTRHGYALIAALLVAGSARAATEAHLIRVDARESDANGAPLLTTLVELGEPSSSGFSPKAFPENDAVLELQAAERPGELVDRSTWVNKTEPGFGTAWLLVVDADRHMGAGLERGKDIALALIDSLRPNDAVYVVIIDDRRVVAESKWAGAPARAGAKQTVERATLGGTARNRAFATLLEGVIKDAFGGLAGAKLPRGVPLHQAVVVLSTGYGGADPKSTGPGGSEIARVLERGRFPEENSAAPKTPVPVVSVAFPFEGLPEHRHNALELMRSLSNPRIGGSFRLAEPGATEPGKAIVSSVRARFDAMHVVRWRLPCVAPSPTQSLRLTFPRAPEAIVGDATFSDVSLGAPIRFPLLVDVERTRAEIQAAGGVVPGGRVRIYGRFCWSGTRQDARGFFLPRGTIVPESVDGADPSKLERARTDLVSSGLSGEAVRTDPGFVELAVPDDSRILHSGPTRALLVLEDGAGPRTSGLTAKTVIQLPARKRAYGWLFWAAVAAGLMLIAGASGALYRNAQRARRSGC